MGAESFKARIVSFAKAKAEAKPRGLLPGLVAALALAAPAAARAGLDCEKLIGLRERLESLPMGEYDSRNPRYQKLLSELTDFNRELERQTRGLNPKQAQAFQAEMDRCVDRARARKCVSRSSARLRACVTDRLARSSAPARAGAPALASTPPAGHSAGDSVGAAAVGTVALALLRNAGMVIWSGSLGYAIGSGLDDLDQIRNGGRVGRVVQAGLQPLADAVSGVDRERLAAQDARSRSVDILFQSYLFKRAVDACQRQIALGGSSEPVALRTRGGAMAGDAGLEPAGGSSPGRGAE